MFTGQKFKTGGELIDEQGTEPWELVMLRHSLLSAHLMNGKGSVEQAKKNHNTTILLNSVPDEILTAVC